MEYRRTWMGQSISMYRMWSMWRCLSTTYSYKGITKESGRNIRGITDINTAFKDVNYKTKDFPIITGQDGDIESVKDIIDGTQSMSVFKDTRILADKVAVMLQQLFDGEKVDSNDYTKDQLK